MSLMITNKGAFFLTDTHVRRDPNAQEIAEMTLICAQHAPAASASNRKSRSCPHSDFGSDDTPSAIKMREALSLIHERAPDLQCDGEMQADSALSQILIRDRVLPHSRLTGEANVLVMPNLDSANIAYQMTKMMADALPVGPILLGAAQPAHVLLCPPSQRAASST